jgi:hypothetical protein
MRGRGEDEVHDQCFEELVAVAHGIRMPVLSSLQILIADDHEIVRRALTSLLSSRPGWVVRAEDLARDRLKSFLYSAALARRLTWRHHGYSCHKFWELGFSLRKCAART